MNWAGSQGLPGVVGGFLNFRPVYFAQTPDQACKENSQFATPRAWENVGRIYGAVVGFGKGDLSPLLETTTGLVGRGVATEFVAFVKRIKELPDPKVVLEDPVKALGENPEMPPDKLAALATALGEYAAKDKKDKKIHLKLLLALAHISGKTREAVANGMVIFQANGGDTGLLLAAVGQNKNDPRIAAIIKHFAASTK